MWWEVRESERQVSHLDSCVAVLYSSLSYLNSPSLDFDLSGMGRFVIFCRTLVRTTWSDLCKIANRCGPSWVPNEHLWLFFLKFILLIDSAFPQENTNHRYWMKIYYETGIVLILLHEFIYLILTKNPRR